MAKYIILNQFRDKYTKELYTEGDEVDITVKRANEIENNLKVYDKDFIERIDNKSVEDDIK